MKFFLRKHLLLLLHISFWVIYGFFNLYNISHYNSLKVALIITFELLFFNMAICYFNYFILLPKFIGKYKITPYLLKLIIPIVLVVGGRLWFESYISEVFSQEMSYNYEITLKRSFQLTMGTLFMLFFGSLLRFTTEWLVLEKKRQELEKQQMAAELKFLRAQINPHFLFNTLNNLYYLAYTKSDNTPKVVDRLAQMMRYMLIDGSQRLVPLKREITYMQHYIDLEKIRLSQKAEITFKVIGAVEPLVIAPFIFMTFLENAFKHGINTGDNDSWVRIFIEVKEKECLFKLGNSKGLKKQNEFSKSSGVGLQNVRRRLELSYANQYRLDILDEVDFYEVNLHLNLS
ncbi:sensor histidine kinase [Xanthovirga aplysinae]|uniref:sensor histidine kinase n=1 Tax=Xanthovirga aplysinae TaxID=2529853 RepID=UPI0012BB4CE3|nr:histidine kinase [Xanthovirga aplysinae]MTI32100.1 sensor histidine kinase [Xanthovirga aplysinae]